MSVPIVDFAAKTTRSDYKGAASPPQTAGRAFDFTIYRLELKTQLEILLILRRIRIPVFLEPLTPVYESPFCNISKR